MNLCDPIARYARSQPEVAAIIDGQRSISYGELADLLHRAAARLLDLGVTPGDRVGVCLRDDADQVISLLALARIGAVVLPLDWRARRHEKERLATSFAAKLLLRHAGSSPLEDPPSAVLDKGWYDAEAIADAEDAFPRDSELPLLINLSSGSTGAPKGCVVTHGQLFARFVAWWTELGMKRGHRYFSPLPLSYGFGRNHCLYNLVGGNTVILSSPLIMAEELVDAIEESDATIAIFVPTLLRRLLRLEPGRGLLLPQLDLLMSGAAPLHPEEKREIARRINPNLYEIYATTGTGVTSVLRPNEIDERADSVGRSSFLSELQIVDEDDRPVPSGTVGRVRCRGPQVASGFWGADRDGGAESFRDGWCYTGDRGAIGVSGHLQLKGRVSDLIIRGGFNIYPEEIEQVLVSHPAVAEAAVAGVPSAEFGEDVAAFVVPRPGASAEDLIAYCRSQLTSHKVPGRIYEMDELPRSGAEKLPRAQLVARLQAGGLRCIADSQAPSALEDGAEAAEGSADSDSLQLRLVEIWRGLLGCEVVGLQDDFFALGGDSLLAVSLFERIESITGRQAPVSTIFEAPTIEALAKSLLGANGAWCGSSLVPLQTRGAKPPFFFLSGSRNHLGDRLGPDQPVYRVVYQDLDRERPFVRVEDMAAHSIEAIQGKQPEGPYFLGGHALGGTVAFEIARQLQSRGEDVALLVLCESRRPGSSLPAPGTSTAYRLLQRVRYHLERLAEVGPGRELRALLQALKRKTQRAVWRNSPSATLSRTRRGHRAAAQRSFREYVPQALPGRITLIRCTERVPWRHDDPVNGWGGLAEQGIEVCEVPGSHTGIYEEPNVRVLAETLHGVLSEARARAAGSDSSTR